MRTPYVVKEVADPAKVVFPLMQYGSLMMKEMQVDGSSALVLRKSARLFQLAQHHRLANLLDLNRSCPYIRS